MGDALDTLLQKLVLEAKQREADVRAAAVVQTDAERAATDLLDECRLSADPAVVGWCSEQGSRDTQEDRFTVVPNLRRLFPDIGRQLAYFGVFDGHEGSACAEFARCSLHEHVVRHPAFAEDPETALREGFTSADRQFLRSAEAPRDSLALQYTPGCTAVVVLVDWDRRRVLVAHVGDSRALIVRTDGSVVPLTDDHTGKSLSADEREGIRRSGVAMVIGSYIWMTTGTDSQRINRHSVSLEVARALGDPLFKHRYNPLLQAHGEDIVSSLPDVHVHEFDDGDDLLVLATDGVFKALSNEEVGAFVRGTADVAAAASALCREAIDRRCGDNTTALIVRLGAGPGREMPVPERRAAPAPAPAPALPPAAEVTPAASLRSMFQSRPRTLAGGLSLPPPPPLSAPPSAPPSSGTGFCTEAQLSGELPADPGEWRGPSAASAPSPP